MNDMNLIILLFALIADWRWGEPAVLWSRFPHPVVLFGKSISFFDRTLNKATDPDPVKFRKGAAAISILIAGGLVSALLLDKVVALTGWIGWVIEGFIVFVLLAQKSLYDHVSSVAKELADNGLTGGRRAVGLIVGRDPTMLNRSGVSRAAIESLAENYSDGVVAPAFWYAVFGLPGLIVYKMINTADSMIAYRNEKYLYFGRVAAQIDDLANWVPARFSAGLIALGTTVERGRIWGKSAILTSLRESGLHRSPNAGWPEAAMAGGADIALGGPRVYANETVSQTWINANGKSDLGAADILLSLKIFKMSCYSLWAAVAVLVLV